MAHPIPQYARPNAVVWVKRHSGAPWIPARVLHKGLTPKSVRVDNRIPVRIFDDPSGSFVMHTGSIANYIREHAHLRIYPDPLLRPVIEKANRYIREYGLPEQQSALGYSEAENSSKDLQASHQHSSRLSVDDSQKSILLHLPLKNSSKLQSSFTTNPRRLPCTQELTVSKEKGSNPPESNAISTNVEIALEKNLACKTKMTENVNSLNNRREKHISINISGGSAVAALASTISSPDTTKSFNASPFDSFAKLGRVKPMKQFEQQAEIMQSSSQNKPNARSPASAIENNVVLKSKNAADAMAAQRTANPIEPCQSNSILSINTATLTSAPTPASRKRNRESMEGSASDSTIFLDALHGILSEICPQLEKLLAIPSGLKDAKKENAKAEAEYETATIEEKRLQKKLKELIVQRNAKRERGAAAEQKKQELMREIAQKSAVVAKQQAEIDANAAKIEAISKTLPQGHKRGS